MLKFRVELSSASLDSLGSHSVLTRVLDGHPSDQYAKTFGLYI